MMCEIVCIKLLMSFSVIKIGRILSFLGVSIALTSVALASVSTQAAEFYPKNEGEDNVSISSTRENVYAAGNRVALDEPIGKDLVAAGNFVEINSGIGRTAMIAGNQININDQIIRGATRIAGNEVTIEGDFGEELIVAGGVVEIRNSRIQGDLIVAAGQLILENTIVDGDASLAVGEYSGDNLNAIVGGEVILEEGGDQAVSEEAFSKVGPMFVVNQIGTIIFLVLVSLYLWRKRKLEVNDIKFNQRFAFDMLTGLVYGLVSLVLILVVLFIYPVIGFSLLGLQLFIVPLTYALIPIFLALLIQNQFNLSIKPYYTIAAVYVALLVLLLIPLISAITSFVLFVYSFVVCGYLLRNSYKLINQAITKTDSESVKDSTRNKKTSTKDAKD
jgi:hypothetical protein